MRHPENELVPFLRGELGARDREHVIRHLAACAGCGQMLDDFRRLLGDLERSAPAPPAVHWARYRAELEQKLAARAAAPSREPSWSWPVPLALSAVLAAILVLIAVRGPFRPGERPDLMAFEETVIGQRLDLLRDYPIIERLDLLEDLDVIGQLERLSPTREG